MRIYKVGGAVRDALLGLEPTDNDWVVVGSTPKEMLSMGYKQVGKDFPVFLHPDTNEEYALARKERSTGPGHTAFNFSFSPSVTLEDDLGRRDITINAIAMDDTGNLIDPFHGVRDLENRMIRHISDAFIEDPLRVLRVARFYTKLHEFNFVIAETTQVLLDQLFPSLKHLPGERIWQETEKVLHMENPTPYFELIHRYFFQRDESRAISSYFKPSGLTFNDVITGSYNIELNPGLKTPESWWAIIGKEFKERAFLDYANERLKVPKSYKKMSELVFDFREKYFSKYNKLNFENKVKNLYKCLERIQPSKNLEFATSVAFLAAHNYLGRDMQLWVPFLKAYSEILPTDEEKKLDGSKIQEILKERKIRLIEEAIKGNYY